MQLEYVERDGGPSVVLVCSIIAVIGLLIMFLAGNNNKDNKDSSSFIKLLTIGPVWLWSKLFDKLKWKY